MILVLLIFSPAGRCVQAHVVHISVHQLPQWHLRAATKRLSRLMLSIRTNLYLSRRIENVYFVHNNSDASFTYRNILSWSYLAMNFFGSPNMSRPKVRQSSAIARLGATTRWIKTLQSLSKAEEKTFLAEPGQLAKRKRILLINIWALRTNLR